MDALFKVAEPSSGSCIYTGRVNISLKLQSSSPAEISSVASGDNGSRHVRWCLMLELMVIDNAVFNWPANKSQANCIRNMTQMQCICVKVACRISWPKRLAYSACFPKELQTKILYFAPAWPGNRWCFPLSLSQNCW